MKMKSFKDRLMNKRKSFLDCKKISKISRIMGKI